jgi:methionyl-tRNA formyltransferase
MALRNFKICLAGKNQIAVDALTYLIELGWHDQIMVCPNQTDTGFSAWQPSLLRYAIELGVKVVTLDEAQQVDNLIFISLEFDRILRPSAFRSNRLYNIHFSNLPAYKGMYTSALPILHGATCSGVTLHEIDSGIDTGSIIAQISFDIAETWTARDLYYAYMDHGFKLFRESVDLLVAPEAPRSFPQPAKGSSYFGKSEIDYACLSINLRDTAYGIVRKLRAFSFREYQTPIINGMEVGGWEILSDPSREKPGAVLSKDKNSMIISTIDYRLQLKRNCCWDWFQLNSDSSFEGFDPAYIDVQDKHGLTPLMYAALAGDARLCYRLLVAGADPNRADCDGTVPLMYAYSGKNPNDVAKVLLAFGADPERKDCFGRNLSAYRAVLSGKDVV